MRSQSVKCVVCAGVAGFWISDVLCPSVHSRIEDSVDDTDAEKSDTFWLYQISN